MNLFSNLPDKIDQELVDLLASSEHVRVERIVSTGQSSPDGFWYDQAETEWVIVLRGEATLKFQDDDDPISMQVGDHLTIAPHRKHRVESTSPDEPTVWLAVFF
ncbi:MAG: cupin domain-containing protein [Rubripirellula sp.]